MVQMSYLLEKKCLKMVLSGVHWTRIGLSCTEGCLGQAFSSRFYLIDRSKSELDGNNLFSLSLYSDQLYYSSVKSF